IPEGYLLLPGCLWVPPHAAETDYLRQLSVHRNRSFLWVHHISGRLPVMSLSVSAVDHLPFQEQREIRWRNRCFWPAGLSLISTDFPECTRKCCLWNFPTHQTAGRGCS